MNSEAFAPWTFKLAAWVAFLHAAVLFGAAIAGAVSHGRFLAVLAGVGDIGIGYGMLWFGRAMARWKSRALLGASPTETKQ